MYIAFLTTLYKNRNEVITNLKSLQLVSTQPPKFDAFGFQFFTEYYY